MAEFVAIAPNVEVNGQTVLSIVAGMGAFQSSAVDILKKHGIINPTRDGWYRQQAWLNAFKEIHDRVGRSTLFQIGQKIPESAQFPPQIKTIEQALAAIDVAYHMNHRGGEIGHYRFSMAGPRQARMVCENPYPCEFDQGIVTAMARRFCPAGGVPRVAHDDHQPCRQKGAASCTYLVSW